MVSYYSAVILLIWLSMGTLCVLVRENDRLDKKVKWKLYLTYLLVAFAALSEWLGLQLNGNSNYPIWVLHAVKCADYILTPMAGGMLVAQMGLSIFRQRVLFSVLAVNTVFQIIACFTDWMTIIDENNQYMHGSLYFFYIAVYVVVIAMILIEFIVFGRTYRRQNKLSLYCIILIVSAGIMMQEMTNGDVRTAYMALTLGAILIFIHYSEFLQIRLDDQIREQKIQISQDPLTGILNRYAFTNALKNLDSLSSLPDDLTAFSVDINDLKIVNDTLGHKAGDELICGAAKCIENVIGDKGQCYRTGGDEFVVLANMEKAQADNVLKRLEAETAGWSGRIAKKLSAATGYAHRSDHGNISAEQLVRESDFAMYAEKAKYHSRNTDHISSSAVIAEE